MAKSQTVSAATTIREVYVPLNFAPLGKRRPGYFVDKNTDELCSIKRGTLQPLKKWNGRYKISVGGVVQLVPKSAIKRARRTPQTPHFHGVPA